MVERYQSRLETLVAMRGGWLLRSPLQKYFNVYKDYAWYAQPQDRVADHLRATGKFARLKWVVALSPLSSLPHIPFSPMIRSPFFKLLAFIWVIGLSHSPALAYYAHGSSASRHSPHGPSKKYCQNLLQRREWYVCCPIIPSYSTDFVLVAGEH